jgi:hypothetical protein
MWQDDGLLPLDPSHPAAQVGDKFIERGDLGLGRSLTIQVADKTDSDCDVVEVIARHVAAVNLPGPA